MIGTTLGNYRISAKLGEGGMGEVYRAVDTTLGRDVALKVLPADMAAKPELVERFRREARTVAALNHPNIVTIYAVEEVDGVHFLSMEVVEGRSLDRLIPAAGLPVERILVVAMAIAEALAAAHEKGIVHRDLKPANVMIGPEDRVKVLDFGLAKIAGVVTGAETDQTILRTKDGVVLGTLPYMSPEQVTGSTADHRSDLFSLGVILYEMAAGRRPFAGRSSAELASAILRDTARPLADVRADLPGDFVRIIRRCLEKAADSRIQTARDICNELRELGRGRIETAIIEIPSVAAGPSHPSDLHEEPIVSRPARRATVGRERERAELAAAFQRAKAGQGSLLCLSGEPGIGKTTLVETFIADLSGERCLVARGRCSERLAGSEAYLPLVDALESLLQDRKHDDVSRVMKSVAPTWCLQVAPASTGTGESGAWPSASSSQERMKRELAGLLQELSRSGPVILFIDDLQWADVSTIDVLSFVAGKLESLSVLLVATYRLSDMLLAQHPFLQIKPDLQARGVCRELTLGFLREAEVAEYLSREFPGHRLPPELPRLIHAKTEGSPLFMADLVSDLRDRGAIEQTAGGWALGHALSDIARDLPESVRGMIERKIAQLSEDDRQLLIAASVQGYEFDSAVVAKVLSLEPDPVEQRLEALERVFAFVRLQSEAELPDGTLTMRYRFVHVLYQNALYASLRPTRRTSLNALVAAALIGFHGKRKADIAAQLAILFTVARNYPAAVEHYLLAAQQATRVFGHAEAAVLAESGLRLIDRLPETERTRAELRLRSRLAGSQMVLQGYGAPDVLATHLRMRELCVALGDDAQRLRAELGLSIVYTVRAEYEKARALAAESFALAERIGLAAMAVQADFCQGLGSFYLGELSDARRQFQRSLDRYDPVGHRSIALYGAVLNRAHLSRTLYWLGYPDRAAALMRDALAASAETRHPIGEVNTLSVAVFVEVLEGRVAAARATSERMVALAEEHGYPYYRAIGLILGGLSRTLETGDDAGIVWMREGLAIHEAAATWQNHATYLILLADALRATGRIDEALSTLVEAEAAIDRTGERYYEPELHRLRGTLILMQNPDAVPRAEASLRVAIDVSRRQGAKSWELRAATSLARLSREHGRPADGRTTLASVVDWFSDGVESAALQEARALLDRW